MRNSFFSRFGAFSGLAGLVVTFFFTNSVSGAETNTNSLQVSIVIPKSAFERPFRDPFYPGRTTVVLSTNNTPAAPQDFYKDITLKGISGPQNNRLALINNKTMAVGESETLKTPQGSRRVELLEIKDKSIIVKIEGASEPKEIYLRQY